MAITSDNLPIFCLERWQSERETRAKILLSESGVEPVTIERLHDLGASIELEKVSLGYGWTRGAPTLRHVIADYLSFASPDNILVTSGGSEANYLTVLSIINPGDTVIVDMPNYMQIPGLLSWRRAEVLEAWRTPLSHWRLPIDDIVDIIRERNPRAIFLTLPNNPTGMNDYDSLAIIASEIRNTHTILVVDEAYRGLEHTETRRESALSLAHEYGIPVIVTGSVSKVLGLPGLRIGWIATTIDGLIRKAWSIKDYTTISPPRLSEVIAIEALREPVRHRLVERARSIVKRNIEILREILNTKGDLVIPSWPIAGSFILLKLPWTRDTYKVSEILFEKYGILVVPGECFDLPGYIRVGLGREDPLTARREFEELVSGLEKIRG